MKRTLQFAWKFRRLALALTAPFYTVVIACGLIHVGSPWMLISLIGVPAVLIESAVKKEVFVGRCLEQLGKQCTHNAKDFGIPSNAAWDAAVLDIRRKGHLHARITATNNAAINRIKLTFE